MKFAREHHADIGVGLLLLLIVRTLAEVFRLEHVSRGRITMTVVRPFVLGALVAALALGGALIARGVRRERVASGIVGSTIAALFVYRVWFINPLLATSPALAPDDRPARQ